MNARNASFFGCYALCLKKWLTGLVWLDNYAWLFYCWCLMYAFACICVCIWCCWRLEYVCVCWWSKKVKLGSGLLCLKLNVENASVVNHFSYKIRTDSKMLSLFFFFFFPGFVMLVLLFRIQFGWILDKDKEYFWLCTILLD